MGINNNTKECLKETKKYIKSLLNKKSVYENFGQEELMILKDKYDYLSNKQIDYVLFTFEQWIISFDDNKLKNKEGVKI